MKKLSMELNTLLCSLSVLVITPIMEYTDTLMTANEIPTQANKILTDVKEFPKYIPKHPIKTSARAINIPFLNPRRGKKDPTKNETKAIERSLKASSELALSSSTW